MVKKLLGNTTSTSLSLRKTEPWPKMDVHRIRNIILETLCLVIIGEIISSLASKNFSWEVSLLTFVEVIILAILSFIAKKAPYGAILSALVVFVGISIASAAIKPTYLGGSIIIKIFILIYLVRAIPDARELHAYLKNKK
ncbi:MAG: hypothetical protein KF862_11610 [Chitinophagaceae bacterium]|nr:hypothetical protein [Chitinophagaceae bacterium]